MHFLSSWGGGKRKKMTLSPVPKVRRMDGRCRQRRRGKVYLVGIKLIANILVLAIAKNPLISGAVHCSGTLILRPPSAETSRSQAERAKKVRDKDFTELA